MWIPAELVSMALDSTTGNTVMWLCCKNENEKRATIQTGNAEGVMPGTTSASIEMAVNLIKSLSGSFLRSQIYVDDQGEFKGAMIISGPGDEFRIECSAPFAATAAMRFNSKILVPESVFMEEESNKSISSEGLKHHLTTLSAIELADYYF